MRSPDSERIEQLFHAASELPTADRAEFLNGADRRLARAVLEMLDGARDPVWNHSALELEARQAAFDFRPAAPGEMFGPYRIVRRVATGGMSFVFEAIRDDAEFHKRVAIKFLQHGIDDAADIGRFRMERQILAHLEHPNIARLLDGGTGADGTPYLVMEYVDGIPLDRFADEKRLNRAQRLGLFLQVCDAVQYAHRNLVVHRDLKPANILVNADGAPKLLDFGIAKLLTGESEGRTLAALTPEYASPEQVLGRVVGTASDIYSLGVLLFLLLAGRLPYASSEASGELMHAICDLDPVWLPAGLIDRDLASILALALRKEPDRRYPSVEQLAADVRRYLEGRPVSARSGAILYRAGKFIRRRTLPLVAATAILIAIVLGVISTVAQSHRVERRFNEVRTLAHSVLFDVYDSIKPLEGSLPARRLMAAKAQQYLDSLSREAGHDPALLRDLGESYLRLGDVLGGPYAANLGDTAGALASYLKARAVIEPEVARHPSDRGLQNELFQVYLSLGRVLTRQNRTDEAIAILNRAIRTIDSGATEQLARAWQYLAEAESLAGERDGSIAELLQAVASARKAVAIQESAAPQKGRPEWQLNLSSRYFSVGYRLMSMARLTGDRSYAAQAFEFQLQGHAINRALAQPGQPSRPLADGLLCTAASRRLSGDMKGALADVTEALDDFKRLAAADPQNIEARRDLANAYGELGKFFHESGSARQAREADRKAIAILEDLGKADPTNGENSLVLARIRERLESLQ